MSSGTLTQHFAIHEFQCAHGLIGNIEAARVVCAQLEALRAEVGKPIVIISGYRCPECNRAAQGATHSQHLLSRAADIVIEGLAPDAVAAIIAKLINDGRMQQGGIGIYYAERGTRRRPFTHYDIRGYPARWSVPRR